MRILFLGSGEFGLPTLQRLVSIHDVCAVISSDDRPAGRNKKMTPTPITAWSRQEGIEVFPTANVNSVEMIQKIETLKVDAMVVIAFGQKLSESVIGDRFSINLHASLLPRWRGASPINAAILNGDAESGVSVISLAKEMDAGRIFSQQEIKIASNETAGELHDRLSLLGAELVPASLAGDRSSIIQDEEFVTYARKISRSDAVLDLQMDAEAVARTIRGYSPWPGCHLKIGTIDCKLLNAVATEGSGEIGEILEDGSIAVGEGSVAIAKLQPAGGKPMSWKDFCNGRSVNAGDFCEAE